jgi:hypothetical protein
LSDVVSMRMRALRKFTADGDRGLRAAVVRESRVHPCDIEPVPAKHRRMSRGGCLSNHNHQPDVVHRRAPRSAAGVLSIMFHDLCRPLDFDPGPLSELRHRVQCRTRLFLPEG